MFTPVGSSDSPAKLTSTSQHSHSAVQGPTTAAAATGNTWLHGMISCLLVQLSFVVCDFIFIYPFSSLVIVMIFLTTNVFSCE